MLKFSTLPKKKLKKGKKEKIKNSTFTTQRENYCVKEK
jgi:hypothetical protein